MSRRTLGPRGERGRFRRIKGMCVICQQRAGQPSICSWCVRAGCAPPTPKETPAQIRARLLAAADWWQRNRKSEEHVRQAGHIVAIRLFRPHRRTA